MERRLRGRELTIGLLGGKALEVVEIKYSKECYDYDTKYLSDSTDYLCPAELPKEITKGLNLKQRLFIQVVDAEISPVLILF